MGRQSARKLGPVFTAIMLVWGVYSTVTSIVEVPEKAQDFAKLLADPPAYLPWAFLAVFVGLSAWGLWPSGPETVLPEPATQSSSGSHSVNIGTNHGPVIMASPPPAATQPARSPYGSGRPPMEISKDAMRGANKLPPLRPDCPLANLVPLVRAKIAPNTDDRAINLAIADWAHIDEASVWGRNGDKPLQKIPKSLLRQASFDYRRSKLSYQGTFSPITLTDIQFNSAQVEEYWL